MKSKNRQKVFVALSGGVDSSVAALLLKNQGYDVVGVHMRCYNFSGCGERDACDAKRAADALKIPFYVFDFEKEYRKKVVDYMIGGYRKGITPNPDVMCNKEIKFGLFLKKALEMGADFVATGHYVRLASRHISDGTGHPLRAKHAEKLVDSYSLFIAKDENKDQSYFLWTLTQKQLKHCLFPIGDYLKSEVRRMARRAGLPTADKKDSQGVCFIGKISLPEFLNSEIPAQKGPILNLKGEKIGEHDGVYPFTVGQRHGIKISAKKPLYVVRKNIKANTLVVAEGSDNPALYKNEINVTSVNFIGRRPKINAKLPVLIRVRYRQPPVKAVLSCRRSPIAGCKLIFDKPQKFIAAGQSAVFYAKNGELLGGGIIA
ncbi:MAG: tRNA 2-thiouridine(34) synthase MnmA [Parcubacteria group bacterium]|nr:tRNA 2-thiouridine(34) synthase MnmA [Parcubacteria group bacterium]